MKETEEVAETADAESGSVGKRSVRASVEEVGSKRVKAYADKMTLVVNELTIAAGTIKVVRHASLPSQQQMEVVFDELNADEFVMKYAD